MAENEQKQTALFSGSGKTSDSILKLEGNSFAVQFKTDNSFCSVSVYVAKALRGGVSFYMSLYEWKDSYGESVNGKALVSREFSELKEGAYADFDVGDMPAGEYIVKICSGSGNVHLRLTDTGNSRTYMNASVHPLSLMAKITWTDGEGVLLEVSDNNTKLVTDCDTWVATDGLGRKVENSDTDTRRENKTVGLFFHNWHSANSALTMRDISKILAEHPEIQNDYSSPYWGSAGAYFWNEPIWNYYRSDDEWVLRRQAELLADAGVDVIFFDDSNDTITHMNDVLTLCKVWSEARADGVNTPKISFMLPMFDYDAVAVQLREIYSKLYGQSIYKELWFYWKGKPLMVGYPGQLKRNNSLDREILDFFTFRVINHSQSEDNIQVQDEHGNPLVMGAIQSGIKSRFQLWNWISVYPQLVNKNKDGTPEEVSVAIAHNWCKETHLTAMNNPKFQVFGRHYDPVKGVVDDREDAKLYGSYFSAQWEYALEIDPEIIWVTGWNEWVAGRFETWQGVKNAFPDNFSDEYSRDIEPSLGDLKDHYYYQFVNYIRKFKGTGSIEPVSEMTKIDISDGSGWEKVQRVYESYVNDTFDRDSYGYKNNETKETYHYKNTTGRNDITKSKAAFDEENLYFMVKTKEALSPYTDPAWMRLFIEIEEKDGVGTDGANWESFQYVVNRLSPEDGSHAVLERSAGGWEWEIAGKVRFSVSGNVLQIEIPRSALGIGNCDSFTVNFKWSDNMQEDGNILDFYVSGDTAPEGRFKYQLAAVNARPAVTETKTDTENEKNSAALIIGGVAAAAAAGTASALIVNYAKKKRKN